jgi:hypothetical protein
MNVNHVTGRASNTYRTKGTQYLVKVKLSV